MKTALYVRVSTEKQEALNQIFALQDYCTKQNHEIYEIYQDVISGKENRRPAFDKLFKDAHKKKFELLLFWDLSRFSRSGITFTLQKLDELTNLGIQWHSYQEQYFSSLGQFKDMVLAIMAALAKIEREKISERTKAGIARARAEGKQIGGKKKDPKIYTHFCGVKGCRVKVRFDEDFCKKHKGTKVQIKGSTDNLKIDLNNQKEQMDGGK